MLSEIEKARNILRRIEPFVDKVQVAADAGLNPQTVMYLMIGKRSPRKKETLPKLYKSAVANFIQRRDLLNDIEIPFLEIPKAEVA